MNNIAIVLITLFCINALAAQSPANCSWQPSPQSQLSALQRTVSSLEDCSQVIRAELLEVASATYNNRPSQLDGIITFQDSTGIKTCKMTQLINALPAFTQAQRIAIQNSVHVETGTTSEEQDLVSAIPLVDQAANCI